VNNIEIYQGENGSIEFKGVRVVEREIEYYNLDMIISIGYRVDSKEATVFRKWATSILKRYITDGYAINEKKLSNTKELIKHLIFEGNSDENI
jgi:hypothetical protein